MTASISPRERTAIQPERAPIQTQSRTVVPNVVTCRRRRAMTCSHRVPDGLLRGTGVGAGAGLDLPADPSRNCTGETLRRPPGEHEPAAASRPTVHPPPEVSTPADGDVTIAHDGHSRCRNAGSNADPDGGSSMARSTEFVCQSGGVASNSSRAGSRTRARSSASVRMFFAPRARTRVRFMPSYGR